MQAEKKAREAKERKEQAAREAKARWTPPRRLPTLAAPAPELLGEGESCALHVRLGRA